MTSIAKHSTYYVAGNTYSFRGDLKSLGGRWNPMTEQWTVQVGGMSSVGQARYILERAQRGGCTVTRA
jgi:hypothetical protein